MSQNMLRFRNILNKEATSKMSTPEPESETVALGDTHVEVNTYLINQSDLRSNGGNNASLNEVVDFSADIKNRRVNFSNNKKHDFAEIE